MAKIHPPESAPDAAPILLKYEVTVPQLKVGGVIAYQGGQVNLTKEQADALNAAQEGCVKFVGI